MFKKNIIKAYLSNQQQTLYYNEILKLLKSGLRHRCSLIKIIQSTFTNSP